MSFDYTEYVRKESAARAKADAITKPNVFAALTAAGIATITVGFDGSGDSGQIESITCEGQTNSLDGLKCVIGETRHDDDGTKSVHEKEVTLEQAIEDLCYDILEESHGGWEINEGAFGEFTIDVPTQKISLEFNHRIETYDSSYEEY